MKTILRTTVLAAALALVATAAFGQTIEKPVVVEVTGGLAVPTGDISDAVDAGPIFGGAVGFWVNPDILLLGEVGIGSHASAFEDVTVGSTTIEFPDTKVNHFMGKAAYKVHESADGKLKILVNAGAGLMTFKADVDDAESDSYFAINAGAKVYYMVSDAVSLVLSPQGDIAFQSDDEDTEDVDEGGTAWVWPFTAGVAFTF